MGAQVIDGKAIAGRLREKLAEETREFHEKTSVQPHLVAILVGDDPASSVYVNMKKRACEQIGLRSTVHQLPAETSQDELLALIDQCNNDDDVNGILVQLPIPDHIDEQTVLDAVHPLKDVDAFHPENVGLIVQGRPRFLPATPHGVQHLLVETGAEIAGAHVVVLGRSEIVGKPMAMMLCQKGDAANATVTICHSRTKNLPEVVRTADIIIAAIGQPRFVTADMVKPGAIVIDVGTSKVDGKLVGDVDFEAVAKVASAITPVPKGVGPMTIAMVLNNTLRAAQLQHPA